MSEYGETIDVPARPLGGDLRVSAANGKIEGHWIFDDFRRYNRSLPFASGGAAIEAGNLEALKLVLSDGADGLDEIGTAPKIAVIRIVRAMYPNVEPTRIKVQCEVSDMD